MTVTATQAIEPTGTQEPLEDRLISAAISALEMYSVHIGRTLGLYARLDGASLTTKELADRAGIDRRYSREWLEQQAVAGFVHVENPAARSQERRYRLTDQASAVFVDPEDPIHVSPLADMVAGVGSALTKVVQAYQTGEGVSFAEYGHAMRAGQGAINRPAFANDLVGSWLGAVDGLVEHLTIGGRVADLGCGVGWSSIAIALGIPGADVTGWDNDIASIEDARVNAARAGVDVHFESTSAESLAEAGPFDLITIFEALHDMAQPTAVLEAARESLAPGGVVLVADEKVAPEFTAPGDEMERMMYGWSVAHCLPAAMAEKPSAAIGTVIRESIVHDLARRAGFEGVTPLDVDAGFFQLYVLTA